MSCNDETFYSILAYGIHGSSKKHGILSTMITESILKKNFNFTQVDLLIASGEILKLSKDENREIFYACLCNLGI
jgi:hypothetical protein